MRVKESHPGPQVQAFPEATIGTVLGNDLKEKWQKNEWTMTRISYP